jgi:hypothetical protein
MSTKVTISYDSEDHKFHLYEECFEDETVYLSILPEEWSFDGTELTIKMTTVQFEKIIKDYCKYKKIE